MRCIQCNELLTDFESTRQDKITGEYLDLCNACFKPISSSIKVKERYDLLRKKDRQALDEKDDTSSDDE
jgi:hypothetical protein